MAAAEYYNAAAAAHSAHSTPQPGPQYSPHHQSPRPPAHELQGSPVPQYSLPPGAQQAPPPPYYPTQQEQKPAVHFAPASAPGSRPSSRPHSSRPSFSGQHRPTQGQYLQPPPNNSPYAQHGSPNLRPQTLAQPPHMRPYMHENSSAYALNNGYSSDPEQRRRRRHKHHDRKEHDRKEDEETSRDVRPRKDRSRSTNTDGFLGAAGGGLIGDLIFPGLGTVGGAVAGWIGGKDYGKHRKYREDKRHKEQKDWEHKFRDRSGSRERRYSDDRYHGDHKRHNSAY